jgi:hypothetical protein
LARNKSCLLASCAALGANFQKTSLGKLMNPPNTQRAWQLASLALSKNPLSPIILWEVFQYLSFELNNAHLDRTHIFIRRQGDSGSYSSLTSQSEDALATLLVSVGDGLINRTVALKTLQQNNTNKQSKKRFFNEAQPSLKDRQGLLPKEERLMKKGNTIPC